MSQIRPHQQQPPSGQVLLLRPYDSAENSLTVIRIVNQLELRLTQ